MRLPPLRITDPGLAALKTAARAAIVMPAVFAVAFELIQQPQAALFASFGSFAMLVLVDFSGSARSRFTAYVSLAAVGAVLVVIGTLCSRNAWLAAAAMAVVGFSILFSGVINGYCAAGGTAAILAFVLPVSIPAPLSAIPWRLAGWGLAACAGTCAVMVLWPPRRTGSLRYAAARACLALAALADAELTADQEVIEPRLASAGAVTDALRTRFHATPHRPTGPSGEAAALAALIDELGWLLVSLRAIAPAPGAELCREENGIAMAAAASVLRASGRRLDGGQDELGTARLEMAQEAVVRALAGRISQLPANPDDKMIETLLGRSFRTRAISYTTMQIAAYAAAATGAAGTPGPSGSPSPAGPHAPATAPDGPLRRYLPERRRTATAQRPGTVLGAVRGVRTFAAEHVTLRSVIFRNSIRGAIGLAVAVFIAQKSGLAHSFWVVLGTLSVLRSNALGTGRSVVSALAGTAAGIVVGAAVLVAVGPGQPLLWGVLPVAVLVAAYAPRVISFAVGQAGFTVVLLVLFNIIQPTGWRVGLIRITDVAIGFAVSLGVGLVFWPRGAAAILRANMAAAYSRGADYIAVTARLLTNPGDPAGGSRRDGPVPGVGGADQQPGVPGRHIATASHGDPGRAVQAGQAATAAVHQLDDAFRQYLAERSATRADPGSAAALVAGAARVLRAGRSMAELSSMTDVGGPNAGLGRYGASMDAQVQAVRSWYVTLADSLVSGTSVPSPQAPDTDASRHLLGFVRDSVSHGGAPALRRALLVLWAGQHLELLRRLEAHLAEQAIAASGRPSRG